MYKKIIYASSLVLALSACSESETIDNLKFDAEKMVQIDAIINSGAPETRFTNAGALSGQAFSAGDQFVIGVKNNDNGPANFSEQTCLRTITVGTSGNTNTYTPNAPLYWDDLGGRGTNAYIWGVYTHGGETVPTTLTKDGQFTWTVAADQSGVTDFQKLDLLYSNNKKNLLFTPDASAPTKRDIANLVFNHAMSRILVNVKGGAGFSSSDFNNCAATLKEQFRGISVDMIASTFEKIDDTNANVTMCRKAAATTGFDASFDAIVAPFKTYAVGQEIATLNIAGNSYKLTATQAFIDALGDSKALAIGKYYTFNLTLSKTGINFTASITDWTNGYETPAGQYESTQIVIDSSDKGANLSDPNNTPYTNQFDLFESKDGEDYDGDKDATGVNPSTNCKYDEESGEWTYDPTLYWQGATDSAYFRGFYPDGGTFTTGENGGNSAALEAGDTDYQWGTSGNEKVSPTSGNVNMQFIHVQSQLIINLKTVTGSAAVNLEGAKVEITHTIRNGSIDLHTGAITLGDKREDYEVGYQKTANGIYTYGTYALPQPLNGADGVADDKNFETSDDAFVKITVNPGTDAENTYYFKLNTAKDANGKPIDIWESNKTYIYNITIKKTEINFDAQITKWILGYESDDITIQL